MKNQGIVVDILTNKTKEETMAIVQKVLELAFPGEDVYVDHEYEQEQDTLNNN